MLRTTSTTLELNISILSYPTSVRPTTVETLTSIQVPSEEQLADILTKPLSNSKHHDALKALNFNVVNSGNCNA